MLISNPPKNIMHEITWLQIQLISNSDCRLYYAQYITDIAGAWQIAVHYKDDGWAASS